MTINSITKKKKKGTATINAKVPGPGQVAIANSGPVTEAGAAKVKQIGLTLTAASSFKLAVKPKGKTSKKLKKKGKAGVKVFVTFTPSGVAGVPNSGGREDEADQAAEEEEKALERDRRPYGGGRAEARLPLPGPKSPAFWASERREPRRARCYPDRAS